MMNSEMGKIEDISDNIPVVFRNLKTNAPIEANVQSDVQLSLKSFFYTWTVGNFSKCSMFCNPKFYSPDFTFENTVWRLRLHATESNGEKKISIRLIRREQRKGDIDFYIKNKVSLIDDEGRVLSENEIESCFQGDSSISGQVSLTFASSKISSLSNDKLIVHCEFLVLASNVCSDADSSYKTPNAGDSTKLPSAVIPPPKPVKSPSPSFPHCIAKRLNERGISTNKEGLLLILLIFLSLQYIFFACEITMKYQEIYKSPDAKNLIKRKEMNELIIDSTLKLKNIAEALNLTDVKVKATEVLTSYLKLYNNTNSTFPLIRGSQINAINASEIFISVNDKKVRLPTFRESKNGQEGTDRHH